TAHSRLDIEPNRHHQVGKTALVAGLDQARPERADQLEEELFRLRALEAVAQELRVEPDLEALAAERDRKGLARLADVRSLRRDLERPLGEREPQWRVLLGEEADPPHDLEQLGRGEAQFVLERFRQ